MEFSRHNPTVSPMVNRYRSGLVVLVTFCSTLLVLAPARGDVKDPKTQKLISRGLDWIASTQSRLGHWSANESRYPTAMTALAGTALLAEGSTTTQGKYAKNIRMAVDYLLSRSRANGLIGDPGRDDRYTYGHGLSLIHI